MYSLSLPVLHSEYCGTKHDWITCKSSSLRIWVPMKFCTSIKGELMQGYDSFHQSDVSSLQGWCKQKYDLIRVDDNDGWLRKALATFRRVFRTYAEVCGARRSLAILRCVVVRPRGWVAEPGMEHSRSVTYLVSSISIRKANSYLVLNLHSDYRECVEL